MHDKLLHFVGGSQWSDAAVRLEATRHVCQALVAELARLDDLVQLERGEFFVWSPQWLRVFKKIRVLPKWTYDSSRTPELGSMLLPGAPRQSSISASELESLRDALLAESETAVRSGTDNAEQVRRERELRLAAERRAERAERAARGPLVLRAKSPGSGCLESC